MKRLFVLSLLLPTLFATPMQASAQTATSTSDAESVDPTLFQTTSFFRQTSRNGVPGDFEVIPAQTRHFEILDPKSFKPVLDPFTGKPRVEKDVVFFYDARTPFGKIEASGANYAILADKSMVAFSSTWHKPIPKGKIQFEVDTYGGNFLIKKGTREIVTVSSTGYVNFFTTVIAPAVRLVGGNWFLDVNNDLWTIDHKGFVYHLTGSKYPLARLPGGNFFYQQDGTIVTIGSNGLPLPAFVPDSKPARLGGNYYVGEDGVLYTVRYDGASFKTFAVSGRVIALGYSYLIYGEGQFVMVDGMGMAHADAVRVSSTRTQFVKVSAIVDLIDPQSVYTPNSRN